MTTAIPIRTKTLAAKIAGETYEAAFFTIAKASPWTATWLRMAEAIVCAPSIPNKTHVTGIKNFDRLVPRDVDALGCSGVDIGGRLAWVYWDLDVGHGDPKQAYETTEEALIAARAIRDFLKGAAEIRLSKSGKGIHVAHLIPHDDLPGPMGTQLAKKIAARLGIRCDSTVLGRQCRWFWARTINENSFQLIEKHEGLRYAHN